MKKKVHDVKYLNGKGMIIEIDGVPYKQGKAVYHKKDGVKHIKHTEFIPVDLGERDKLLSELGEKLAHTVPPKRVVEEMFKNNDTKELRKLIKRLDSGEVKAKSTDGCLGITFKNDKKKKSSFMRIYN